MRETVYRLCHRDEWLAALEKGNYDGGTLDRRDGFIHLSTREQLGETASLHFSQARDLVLLTIDAGALGQHLRWEPSRGGALFPHLYGTLPLSAVVSSKDLPDDAENRTRGLEGP